MHRSLNGMQIFGYVFDVGASAGYFFSFGLEMIFFYGPGAMHPCCEEVEIDGRMSAQVRSITIKRNGCSELQQHMAGLQIQSTE